MDDDKVILRIASGEFYLDLAEALAVAKVLCSSSRIKDMRITDDWGHVLVGPDIEAASIVPMTGHYWIQLEANRKAKEEREAKK